VRTIYKHLNKIKENQFLLQNFVGLTKKKDFLYEFLKKFKSFICKNIIFFLISEKNSSNRKKNISKIKELFNGI